MLKSELLKPRLSKCSRTLRAERTLWLKRIRSSSKPLPVYSCQGSSPTSQLTSTPPRSHQYSLYGMVSNIQWLPTEKGSHRIQGTASNQSLADQLRNFSLDTTRQSEQWITDHLWDLVSPVA